MSLTFITDHVAKSLARLIEQYKGKPRITGTITALSEEVQVIEDTLKSLHEDCWIDTSEGEQLDRIGVIVGLDREPGQLDADYLPLLKSKIIQNLNEGTAEEVISAAKFFLGASSIIYLEVYPAEVNIYTEEAVDPTDAARIIRQIRKFLPAGVALSLFGIVDPDNALIFDALPGFGDTDDPMVGGYFADILTDEDLFELLLENNENLLTENDETILVVV